MGRRPERVRFRAEDRNPAEVERVRQSLRDYGLLRVRKPVRWLIFGSSGMFEVDGPIGAIGWSKWRERDVSRNNFPGSLDAAPNLRLATLSFDFGNLGHIFIHDGSSVSVESGDGEPQAATFAEINYPIFPEGVDLLPVFLSQVYRLPLESSGELEGGSDARTHEYIPGEELRVVVFFVQNVTRIESEDPIVLPIK